MVTVSGRLLDFVEDPSHVAQVQVRAREVRPHGDGVMLDHPVRVDYAPSTGTVTFDAAAGTAGVIMWHAVGRSHASGSLPLVVPEGTTATLRECVEAALLADEFTLNALERLALEVTGMVATIQNITQLEEWADSAKRDATRARWEADRAEAETATIPQEVQSALSTSLAPTIQSELDTRVPPEVAEAIAADRAVADAAAAAVGVAAGDIKWDKGLLPEGTDLATTNLSGAYGISTANRATISDLPPTSQPAVGVITLVRIGNTKYQQMAVHGGTPELWHRSSQSIGVMQPWRNLLDVGSGDGPDAVTFGFGGTNELRLQRFREDYPLVSTGGKGAVVFRYDHGLTNFKNVLLPLHQARGIPAYIAMNSRLWDISENNGATQAEARSWLASGLVEFGNHTAHHENVPTIDGLFDTIVNGRKELEDQLGIDIHGFTVPGISGDGVWDVGAGNIDAFSDSIAGSLILANHAITSGFLGQPHRVMDGVIRQGGRHYTWERTSFADIKEQIDQAIATKTALTLMCHPRTMESTSGGHTYWDAALATQVLDYVAARVADGSLANISYYQSHHATTGAVGRTPRVLLHAGDGDPTLADFPDAQVGDRIERTSDGARWKVES